MNRPVPTRSPGYEKMTDAEAERLRAKVPDDPIPLPPDQLACEGCGVAVPTHTPLSTVTPMNNGRLPASPVQFTRCPSCQAAHDQANAYVEGHPALALRIGPEIAVERVEAVLLGLEVLGQRPVSTDLGLLLPRLHPAAHGVRFANPVTLTRDLCSPRPWAHVTLAQRAQLRAAYAAALRDRLALSAPPVSLRCPTGGCLFCGLASVKRAAIEVARRGGVEAASRAVWRSRVTSPVALGGRGPNYIEGHACPDCAAAIEDAGAVGWPARAQALVTYLGRSEPKKAERLRSTLTDDFPPVLPAWGAFNLRPSAEPWAHLRRVIDRL